MYKYEFETVMITNGLKEAQDNNMTEVEELIVDRAQDGWKLVQVLVVPREKMGVYMPFYYKVIFEKEI